MHKKKAMNRRNFIKIGALGLASLYAADLFGKNQVNGYEYVDLGLPSGTLWATCNVGASMPHEQGLYFAYGESKGYRDASKRKFTNEEYNYDALFQDAATANMGTGWKMPTKGQFEELREFCNYEFTNGGALFTSKINGEKLFLPACGYADNGYHYVGNWGSYWSRELDKTWIDDSWGLFFSSTSATISCIYRYRGFPVRAVVDKTKFKI